MKFTVISKNNILINGIAGKFGMSLEKSDKQVFVMPGTIRNSTVTLRNTKLALLYFVECEGAYLDPPEEDDMAEPSQSAVKVRRQETFDLFTDQAPKGYRGG